MLSRKMSKHTNSIFCENEKFNRIDLRSILLTQYSAYAVFCLRSILLTQYSTENGRAQRRSVGQSRSEDRDISEGASGACDSVAVEAWWLDDDERGGLL